MKKVNIDYEYLTADLLRRVAAAYPDGFKENDVIVFSEVETELEDRVKIVLDNKVYLVKKSLVENLPDTFDDEYFKSIGGEPEGNCDAEYCES
ncbi:hypothetical protein [Flagellimonas flava]|uniref:hypothetical protein n=1 Tax=Flagellimonas flava TaxID=570519 RepID=UPI003D64DF8F